VIGVCSTCATLGGTVLASDGSYSISFTSDAFSNNGGSHVLPNLQVQLFDPMTGTLITQSSVITGWVNGQVVDPMGYLP
jgi:hypothetical protein